MEPCIKPPYLPRKTVFLTGTTLIKLQDYVWGEWKIAKYRQETLWQHSPWFTLWLKLARHEV